MFYGSEVWREPRMFSPAVRHVLFSIISMNRKWWGNYSWDVSVSSACGFWAHSRLPLNRWFWEIQAAPPAENKLEMSPAPSVSVIFWSLDVAQCVSVGFLHLCYGLVGENGVSDHFMSLSSTTHMIWGISPVWSTIAAGRVTVPVEVHESLYSVHKSSIFIVCIQGIFGLPYAKDHWKYVVNNESKYFPLHVKSLHGPFTLYMVNLFSFLFFCYLNSYKMIYFDLFYVFCFILFYSVFYIVLFYILYCFVFILFIYFYFYVYISVVSYALTSFILFVFCLFYFTFYDYFVFIFYICLSYIVFYFIIYLFYCVLSSVVSYTLAGFLFLIPYSRENSRKMSWKSPSPFVDFINLSIQLDAWERSLLELMRPKTWLKRWGMNAFHKPTPSFDKGLQSQTLNYLN